MRLSFSAINSLMEAEAAKDPEYRALLKVNEKRLLSDFRAMSDEEILAGFERSGIPLDRARLEELTRTAASAQGLGKKLIDALPGPLADKYHDWVWMGLVCLWERWIPHRPSLEMVDTWMQEGYRRRAEQRQDEALEAWRRTWNGVRDLCHDCAIRSFDGFDEAFGGTNSVYSWIQDYVDELANATLRDVRHARERIEVCFAGLALARNDESRSLERRFRMGMAEAFADLGDATEMDQVFGALVREFPDWPWGWLAWAQVWTGKYQAGVPGNPAKAESILLAGLAAVKHGQGTRALGDQLKELREDCGNQLPANPVPIRTCPLEPAKPAGPHRPPPAVPSVVRTALVPEPRVGRNEPCPCGSGRKFKKCCGAR